MKKRKVIKGEHMRAGWPVTSLIVTYLLYKQLNLHGTGKGVFLTLAAIWWTVVLAVVISQIFLTDPSDPVFKDEL